MSAIRNVKLAAILAAMAAFGHPSIAPGWHRAVWVGKRKRGNRRNRSRFNDRR